MPRVYERKFDWDEAARLRAKGLTYNEIARRFGVSSAAVKRAVDPVALARARERTSAWQRGGKCPDCGARTTRRATGSLRCVACSALARTRNVREDELRCQSCGEWKPDNEFPHSRIKKCEHRRGRHGSCRSCQTIQKRAWRVKYAKPCKRCGKPTCPDGGPTTGLCLACYMESRKAAA